MSRRSRLSTPCLAFFLLLLAVPSVSAQRAVLPPGSTTNAVPKAADSIITTDMGILTPVQLAQSLLGPGVTISNVVYSGAPLSAGTFSGGAAPIGFPFGIILSSGDISSVPGPNTSDSTSTDTLTGGDPQLTLMSGFPTFNATSLEFDFTAPASSQVSFQYVFSSEEYNEWVWTTYNDIFAFFLNGQNIALLPDTTPVSINTVNCDNPYNPALGQNCALFINNSCVDLPAGAFPCPGVVDTEMDGLTVVLTASGPLLPGTNHIRLAIADAGDPVYDSNVFIRAGSFSGGAPGPYFDYPSPCGHTLHATVGIPFSYTVVAKAATGLPANAVTLTSSAIPAGATHTPGLPLAATGQNATATTQFDWIPQLSDVGNHQVDYLATDQLSQSTPCSVTIIVQEAVVTTGQDYLVVGVAPTNVLISGGNGRVLLATLDLIIPVTPETIPEILIPPFLFGYHLYAQFGRYDPTSHPSDPFRMSNGVDITFGVGWVSYGPTLMGITAIMENPPLIFEETSLDYEMQE